jgi:ubiquinone/menaquinone biosynthesis C-methylase UbiE
MAPQPDTYTHGHQDSVLRAHRWRTAENSAAYLLPLLRSGDRLLDVGCGPGTLTADLALRVAPGQVTGIDVVPSVLGDAGAHARDAGAANVTFLAGDFRQAGLPPASFDVVHAHQLLQHLREPVGALAAMARLAVPGGLVAAREADYSTMAWAPADARIRRWLDVYLAVTRHNGAEANAGRWLLRWAHAAGLTDVVYTTSTWTFATRADRAYWGGQWAERCVASTFAEQAVAYGVATAAELAGIAEGWREWSREPDGVFVVVHGEIVARVGGPR